MDKRALALGIGASLILAAGTANAGTCTTEIQALQAQLGSSDTANATTGPSDPGVQQPSPSANATGTGVTVDTNTSASTDNNANATIGANGAGVQQPSPTADATTGTGNGTTMDSDTATADANSGANATIGATDPGVQQPDGGGAQADAQANATTNSTGSSDAIPPTVAETSRAGEMSTSAGGRTSALVAIAKAKQLDQAGQEDACMSEVNTAKQQLGIQ